MKNRGSTNKKPFYLVLALIATCLALIGSASLDSFLSFPLQIIGSLAIGIVVYAMFLITSKHGDKSALVLNKVVASFILIFIIIGTVTAIRSLWFNPMSNDFGTRFAYENVATGASFAAIVLTLILSALQKDIYWIARLKSVKLDERQLRDRQNIFEHSYKLGVFVAVGGAWYFMRTINNIPTIMDYAWGSVPGHLYWLPVNLVVVLLALPLVLAAWKAK